MGCVSGALLSTTDVPPSPVVVLCVVGIAATAAEQPMTSSGHRRPIICSMAGLVPTVHVVHLVTLVLVRGGGGGTAADGGSPTFPACEQQHESFIACSRGDEVNAMQQNSIIHPRPSHFPVHFQRAHPVGRSASQPARRMRAALHGFGHSLSSLKFRDGLFTGRTF